MATAIAFEIRMAGARFRMKMKGIVTGNVERKTRRNTPAAPIQSFLPSSRAEEAREAA